MFRIFQIFGTLPEYWKYWECSRYSKYLECYLNIGNNVIPSLHLQPQCVSPHSTDQVHHLFDIKIDIDRKDLWCYRKDRSDHLSQKVINFTLKDDHSDVLSSGHYRQSCVACGCVIMVISSPCTSTRTSPAFSPALYAGVSIPRTFSTWKIFSLSVFFCWKKFFAEILHLYNTFITVATSAPPTILRPHALFPSRWISRSTTW